MPRSPLTLVAALALAARSPAQYQTAFDDDTGWTFTSDNAQYGWDVDDDPAGEFQSAPKSLNVQYPAGETVNASALSPAIDVSALTWPELSFWTKCDWAEDVCVYDIRRVRVFEDGGTDSLDYCLSKRVPSGGGAYVEFRMPIDPDWDVVRVQFDFWSIDDFANGGKGWFIDDLAVADVACPAPGFFCHAGENSLGQRGSLIDPVGSTSVAADDLTLTSDALPTNQFAIFFFGDERTFVAQGGGFRCVAGTLKRLPVVATGAGGMASLDVDYGSPPGTSLAVGSTWSFQCWYRDPAGPGGSNLSDAVQLTFCP